jgi:Flp pilus assembly protein TadG
MKIFGKLRNKNTDCKCDIDGQRVQSGCDQEKGQSLVEMAIMMIVLLLILGGVLDLGRMYFTYLALQNAAGEGASYGAINPTWVDSSDNDDPNNIVYRVQNESTGNLIDWSTTNVIVEAPNTAGGQPITVTVSYVYDVITPMVQAITGETITLTARDTQLIFLDESN